MSDEAALLAIVYDDGASVAAVARRIAERWRNRGARACGLIEEQIERPGRRRCDMLVHELASGERIAISQDRGALARGCALDVDGLLRAGVLVRQALAAGSEHAMFNKFGKSEAEGGGLRDTIAEAIAAGARTVVFVPRRNLDAWRLFAGDLGTEVEIADFALEAEGAA